MDHPDRQRPGQQTPDGLDGGTGTVRGGQGVLRVRQQRLAGGGEVDATIVADQQRGAEFLLQTADRRGQGGLHNVNFRRRPGEVQFFGHRDEMLQLAQFHSDQCAARLGPVKSKVPFRQYDCFDSAETKLAKVPILATS